VGRLPPGTLGLRGSIRSLVDDRFYLTEAARHGPVFKTAQFHRRVVCVVGLERAARLLREHDADLAVPPLAFSRAIPRGFVRYMSPADHARYSPALRAALSRDLIRACEPLVRSSFDAALDRMARASAASAGGVDPRPDVQSATFAALAGILLGITADTDAFAALQAAHAGADHRAGGARARREHARYVVRVTDVLRANPVPRASVLTELLRADPRGLDDGTLAGNLAFALKLAHDNTSGLLLWIVKMLGTHPEDLAGVRALARSAPDDARALAQAVVLETLRLEQSEYIYRVTARELDVDGFTIPAGWFVRLCVRESHRSAVVFPDPERFDPARFVGQAPPDAAFAPFGLGRHACIGGALATTIGRILVEELAAREWRITADGPRTRIRWRHWGHWMPALALRVRMGPRRAC
jgi:cytochrome P450